MALTPSTPPIHNADSRPWRDVWKAIVHLVSNDINPINYAVRTKKRAILSVSERLDKLESIVKEFASSNPFCDEEGWSTCHYCHCFEGKPHKDNCLWQLTNDTQKEIV